MFLTKGQNIRIFEKKEQKLSASALAVEIILAAALFVCFWLTVMKSLQIKPLDSQWITGGLPFYVSRVMGRLTEMTYRIHLGMESGEGILRCAFTPVLIAVTGILSWFSVRMRNHILLAITLAAALAGLITGFVPACIQVALLLAVIVVIAFYKAARNGACRKYSQNAVLAAMAAMCLLLVISGIALATGAGGSDAAGSFKEGCMDRIHQFKYEKGSNPMPEGRVAEAGAFRPEEKVALHISAGKPETLYLKGFTGEQYRDGRWIRLDGKKAGKSANMFYWLHDDGFYGQSQVASAYEAAGKKPAGFVSVTATNACRKYCYLPYGASQAGGKAFADKKSIGDLNVEVRSSEDSAEYIYNIDEGAVNGARGIQKKLKKASKSNDPKVSNYLDDEETYRKFCYKSYLDIPEDVEKTLNQCLGPRKKLSSAEAMAKTLAYLNKNVKYSENSSRAYGNEDFINYFLTDSHRGYSIHYASAAVMMMRYYGVPARYVEGYILPETLIKESGEASSVVIPMRYAHAWAEYYLDGVGWIPFETVPKYQNSGSSGTDDSEDGDSTEEEKQQSENNKTENPLNRIGRIFVMNIPALIGLIILILLALIIWTIIRRRRLKKYIESFRGEDASVAVRNAFAYALMLLKKSGYEVNPSMLRESLGKIDDDKYRSLFAQAIVINEEARYSQEYIGDEKRNKMIEFTEETINRYKNSRKPVLKLIDRFIRCIY